MPGEIAGLAIIDYVIIMTYMVGVLIIGTYYGKYVKSAGDLFIAGKSLPFWAIGMSIVVTDIGAIDFVSGAGAAYKYGLAQANFDWIGSMPAMVFAAFIFVPYYWRAGVFTIPEFLGKRYNTAVQMIAATIWGIFLVTMLGVMLWTTAVMMNTVLGWNHQTTIWLTAGIVGIYTVSGGLAAVVMTDVIQLVVMYVGASALLALSFWTAGGWHGIQERVLALGGEFQNHFTLYLPHDTPTPYPWTGIVFGLGIVLATAYFCGNQAVVQRVLGARSEWDAKGGMLFGGLLKLFIPVLVMIPGIAALALYPGLKEADTALPLLIKNVLPPGLTGLMFAAFFAALMSSVDSYLNSASTLWTQDIYGRILAWMNREPSMKHTLVTGRIVTAAMILIAGLFAPIIDRFETIYVAIQTMLSMFQGPTFAILLLGILWKRATRWGALAGLILGVGSALTLNNAKGLFPSDSPFLFVAWWSFVFSLIVTVVVSLLTPAELPEKIRGLVYSQVLRDDELQQVLKERVGG
jgi:SSS family solute:Na+ symporter